jgi:hypothetical protein
LQGGGVAHEGVQPPAQTFGLSHWFHSFLFMCLLRGGRASGYVAPLRGATPLRGGLLSLTREKVTKERA